MKTFQNAELLPNFFTKPRFGNFLDVFRQIAQLGLFVALQTWGSNKNKSMLYSYSLQMTCKFLSNSNY